MKVTIYKGYAIETVGISRYIYRPGAEVKALSSDGYAQTLAEAKRWVNSDLEGGN